jgi:putative endonuclease
LSPSRPFSPSDAGRRAEAEARAFLEKKGYAFLDANVRTPMGEVDLVMKDKETVVFVEVRERTNESFGRGFETVTAAKQAKVAKAALAYVKEKRLAGSPLRFDVVSLGPRGLEHIPNAFVPPAGRYAI